MAAAGAATEDDEMPSRKGYKHFYWRTVADDALLVCLECEGESGDPAAACNVQLVKVERSIFIYCYRCGKKERLICARCRKQAEESGA
jgi:predicted RNA-binding Zn-ribbon protein involved in translation (DUF1610 family)